MGAGKVSARAINWAVIKVDALEVALRDFQGRGCFQPTHSEGGLL